MMEQRVQTCGTIDHVSLSSVQYLVVVSSFLNKMHLFLSFLQITDNTFISRVLMLTLLGLFTLISLVCMFLFHWMEPIFAKPIKAKRF